MRTEVVCQQGCLNGHRKIIMLKKCNNGEQRHEQLHGDLVSISFSILLRCLLFVVYSQLHSHKMSNGDADVK